MLKNIFKPGHRARDKGIEFFETINSFDHWKNFIDSHLYLFDHDTSLSLAKISSEKGAIEPLTNIRIPPNKLDYSQGIREGLFYNNINSRMRAVMLVIHDFITKQNLSMPKIYATEAITPFALILRGKYTHFIGSEYASSDEQKKWLYPILSENLQSLSHPNNSFDIVNTNEVLEHVPSIDEALSEIHRVLKPNGCHIGTVPFAYSQEESIVRAVLKNGAVIHLMEPEYHGNPVDENGSLVFEIPGWGILERARAIGFRDAHMKFVASSKHACFTEHSTGIMVLCLQK